MINSIWESANDQNKILFYLSIAEKVFFSLDNKNPNYFEGKRVLALCKESISNKEITGDDLYALIDSPNYFDITEFAQNENDSTISEIWYTLVDAVGYASWKAYKRDRIKFLPQALENIEEKNIEEYIYNIIKSGLLKKEEIDHIITQTFP